MIRQVSNRLMCGVLSAGSRLPVGLRRWLQAAPICRSLRARFLEYFARESGRQAYRVLSGPAKGLNMALNLPDEKTFWLGDYEPAAAGLLAAHTRPGDVCWDVGTYIGYFSLIMAQRSLQAVYCFEPLPNNQQRIAEQQGLNPNLKLSIVSLALGAAPGEADFLLMNELTMGKLAASSFQSDRPADGRIRVQVKTIDAAVSEGVAPRPDLLKIDTEGAEYQVLCGAQRTLAEHRPRILLEVHGCAEDPQLFELLTASGYHWTVAETGSRDAFAQAGQHIFCEWSGDPCPSAAPSP